MRASSIIPGWLKRLVTARRELSRFSLPQNQGHDLFAEIFTLKPRVGPIPIGGTRINVAGLNLTMAQLASLGIRGQAYIREGERIFFFDQDQFIDEGRRLRMSPLTEKNPNSLGYRRWCYEALEKMLKAKGAPQGRSRLRQITHVNIGGGIVEAETYYAGPETLRRLGINPGFLFGWPEVQVVRAEDYKRFNLSLGVEEGKLLGIYGHASDRQSFEVLLRQRQAMQRKYRQVLVPENCSAEVLAHEILHDHYLHFYPYDAEEKRGGFAECVYQAIVQAASLSKADWLAFFSDVAARTGSGYDLNRLVSGQPPFKKYDAFWLSTHVFFSEVFSYAGTQVIGYPTDIRGIVPARVAGHLESLIVVPELRGSRGLPGKT